MRGLLRAMVLGGLAGCTSIFGLDSPLRERDAAVDVDAVDAVPDAPLGPWGNIAQVIMSTTADDDPSLTDDMLELYFDRAGEIFVAKRSSVIESWGATTNVVELTSGFGSEGRPQVSGDGLLMIFSSNRSPSMGADLWWSQRPSRSDVWQAPMQFTMINSAADEVAGPQTENTLEIVYGADRTTAGAYDLYFAKRPPGTAAVFDQGLPLAFNTAETETSPFLTRNGQHLYFSRDGATTMMMADLYVSHRMSATEWSSPEAITELNVPAAGDSDPWVSPDEHHMFFARHVAGVFKIHEATR